MVSDATVVRLVWRGGLQVLLLAAIVAVLWRGLYVIELVAVAALLAAAAETPVAWLQRHGWRRSLAIAAVLVGALAVLGALIAVVLPPLGAEVTDLANRGPDLLDSLRSWGAVAWLRAHGVDVLGRAADALRHHAPSLAAAAFGVASGVASALTALVTAVALVAFMLASGPRVWRSTLAWVPPERRPHLDDLAQQVRRAVAGYVVGVAAVAAVAASVTGVTTFALGVPYALPLAVATAFLGIIPYLGAVLTGLLVVGITLATAGQTAAAIAAVVFVAYQQLEGTVLQPAVQRRAVALEPLVVLVALLLGLAALGVYAGIMTLPFAAAVKVVASDALARRHARWHREAQAAAARTGGSGKQGTPPGVAHPASSPLLPRH